jgi:hypothetical protein
MDHETILGAAGGGADIPLFGRRRDQHRARHRAGFAHRLPRILHAG